jgi:hypothetical protein
MAWQVDFFLDERGDAPVQEYLTTLPIQHRAKALALIKMLEQEGPNLPFPYSSQVRGQAERTANAAGERQVENSLFWRRKKGIRSSARHCEAARATARGGHSRCGSA